TTNSSPKSGFSWAHDSLPVAHKIYGLADKPILEMTDPSNRKSRETFTAKSQSKVRVSESPSQRGHRIRAPAYARGYSFPLVQLSRSKKQEYQFETSRG
ncbi:hypothetical protein N9153_03530, partial [Planctomicrobium sp.]|nr:hypothetical protein [Planctomicrobium sp.]